MGADGLLGAPVLLAGARRERAALTSRDLCVVTSSVRVAIGAVGRGRSAQAASSEQ